MSADIVKRLRKPNGEAGTVERDPDGSPVYQYFIAQAGPFNLDRKVVVLSDDEAVALADEIERFRARARHAEEIMLKKDAEVAAARFARYGAPRAAGSEHTTACSIWGDDGMGNAEGFDGPLPCNCHALTNYYRGKAEDAEAEVARLREAAQAAMNVIEMVENRCMAADGPVTPTCDEITDDELREIYHGLRRALQEAEDG